MVQWRGRRESENVEDRRSEEGQGSGGGFPFPFPGSRGGRGIPGGGKGGIGIFGILIALGLMLLFGIDPRVILGGGGDSPFPLPRVDNQGQQLPRIDVPDLPWQKEQPSAETTSIPGGSIKATDDGAAFVKVMLADTEDVWSKMFEAVGRRYTNPTMVLFTGETETACGPGMAMMGPFYCPLDQKVYIDLAFYDELAQRFGAPGDFAQAYVIAHEVGHHVQLLLGIAEKVMAYKSRVGEGSPEGNAAQVRMELQADCYAGVWAARTNEARRFLENGDVEEGLRAATAIGDDMIQKKTQGRVVPDAFTHGSSAQRVKWFRAGLETGDPKQCDTFSVEDL